MKHTRAVSFSRLLGLAAILVVCVADAEAYAVRLAWRPVAGAAGYKLYARQNGYPDPVVVDIGTPTADASGVLHYEHGGLLVESTHAFSLATYNAARVESARSNELTVAYATAATIVDSDGDGLADAQEDKNVNLTRESTETDRLRADSDGDGVNDGTEVNAGTDPLNPSSRPGGATATRTATPVRTATTTPTRTKTPTPIPTATRTPSPTRTASRTATPVRTATRTATPVRTATRTATPVRTATRTATPVRTSTRTATPAPSRTATPRPTATSAQTVSPTETPPPATPVPTPIDVGEVLPPVILSVERID